MIYLTADLHINHRRALQFTQRTGFNSIEEHDKTIIENINKRVGRRDTLWILGDVAFYSALPKLRQQIRCKNVKVIKGNHDRLNKLVEVFGKHSVFWFRTIKLTDGTVAFLNHFPCMYWDKSHYNSIHMFGHMHNEHLDVMYSAFPNMRSLDVGIDSAKEKLGRFEPFSETEVLELMKNRAGHHKVNRNEK